MDAKSSSSLYCGRFGVSGDPTAAPATCVPWPDCNQKRQRILLGGSKWRVAENGPGHHHYHRKEWRLTWTGLRHCDIENTVSGSHLNSCCLLLSCIISSLSLRTFDSVLKIPWTKFWLPFMKLLLLSFHFFMARGLIGTVGQTWCTSAFPRPGRCPLWLLRYIKWHRSLQEKSSVAQEMLQGVGQTIDHTDFSN